MLYILHIRIYGKQIRVNFGQIEKPKNVPYDDAWHVSSMIFKIEAYEI